MVVIRLVSLDCTIYILIHLVSLDCTIYMLIHLVSLDYTIYMLIHLVSLDCTIYMLEAFVIEVSRLIGTCMSMGTCSLFKTRHNMKHVH